MFTHLTLLNHHKRIHNQGATDNSDQDQAITVVTQSQNIVQAQNLVSENGQTLGQIQIVATESLEPAHQLQQTNEVTVSTTKTITLEKLKCMTCGNTLVANPKRKGGPKVLRCETCTNNDNMQASQRAGTQIFVAPDGDVKFEIGELPTGNGDPTIETLNTQNVIPLTQVSNNNVQNVVKIQQNQQPANNTNNILPGHHPVKRRNLASVTKCQKCNGSGVIFIGCNQRNIKPE